METRTGFNVFWSICSLADHIKLMGFISLRRFNKRLQTGDFMGAVFGGGERFDP